MFEMNFENQYGKLRLSGGAGTLFRTAAIEGLGFLEREFNVTSYGQQPGQVLISQKDLARVVTVSGDVCVTDGLKQELSRMMRILYHPGKLTIFSGVNRRVIACRCTSVSEPKRHGQDIATVVMQFVCDHPYFSDETEQKVSLFHRKNLICSTFTLPCVFTERVHRLNVINGGDVPTEPVIAVFNDVLEAAGTARSLAFGLAIINHTTGQEILLEYQTEPGETVTIDIPGRQVTSSVAGDITGTISQNSFLSDFALKPGVNDIEVVNYSFGQKIGVVLHYDNQYIEAVI